MGRTRRAKAGVGCQTPHQGRIGREPTTRGKQYMDLTSYGLYGIVEK